MPKPTRQDKTQPAKWYANPVNVEKIKLRAIAGWSSLTRGDVESVLSNFVD